MSDFTKYSLRLIKDHTCRFPLNKLLTKPKDIVSIVNKLYAMNELPEEAMIMFCLDCKSKIIGCFEISRGTLTSSLVHPREVLKRALLCNAYSIILIHNHPSSDPTASKMDIDITKKMKQACDLMGIFLIDHIIVADEEYCSCKEIGYI